MCLKCFSFNIFTHYKNVFNVHSLHNGPKVMPQRMTVDYNQVLKLTMPPPPLSRHLTT